MYDLDNRIDLMRLHSDYQKLCDSDERGRAALVELFNREKITGWHATRVLSEEEIRREGLKAYSKGETINRFRCLSNIAGLDSNGTDAVLRMAKRYLDEHPRRTNHVCFYLLESMNGRYSKYSSTLGGETFRWSAEGCLGEGAGEKLAEIGIPIRVKFAFNFNRIQPYAQDLILPKFVKALDSFYDVDRRSFEVDGAIEGSIAPQDILVIAPQPE
mgnify:CR=1 FL=1